MQEINICQKVCSVNNVLPDANGNVSFNLNFGINEPTTFKSLINWDAMATACNCTVADLKNVINTTYGTWGYGGDKGGTHADGTEFKRGDIILNKSLHTLEGNNKYDEILVVSCTDSGTCPTFSIWKMWELAYAFKTFKKFNLLKKDEWQWDVNGTTDSGETTRPSDPFKQIYHQHYPRILCDHQNCGIIDIFGIKY